MAQVSFDNFGDTECQPVAERPFFHASIVSHEEEKEEEEKEPLVKTEAKFISSLIRHFPKVSFETAKRLLLKETSDDEVEPYLSMLAEILPNTEVRGTRENSQPTLSSILEELIHQGSPFPTDSKRSRKVRTGESDYAINMEKMYQALRDPWQNDFSVHINAIYRSKAETEPDSAHVNTAYKRKAQKVQPVNANDGSGDGPGGRPDWYERSKARETAQ